MSGIDVPGHGVLRWQPHILWNGRPIGRLESIQEDHVMAGTDGRDTAKIYELSAFRRTRSEPRAAEKAKPAPMPSFGGAWYHEAAIRDDERPRRT
jgi:hypothetical protein